MGWAIVISRNLTMGVAWHRFLAFFNIYFKREETGRTALGALRPMMSGGVPLNFEKADPEVDTFGAGKIEDFSWKGWLDFSTCTECGRCQSQCPAWNTAKPLSPKLVMLALRDHAFAKAPYLAAGGGTDMDGARSSPTRRWHPGRHTRPRSPEAGRPLVGAEDNGIIDPEVLWDCTTCGACVEQCPVDIEHVDHIVDMRRYQVMIESEFPTELGGLFRNLENKGNPWGQNPRPAGLGQGPGVRGALVSGDLDDHEYLFWVGCAGAFEDQARRPPGPSPSCCTSRRSASPCWAPGKPAPATRHGGPATSSCSRCWPIRTSRPSTPRSATGSGERSSSPVRTASTRCQRVPGNWAGSTRWCTTRSC